MGWSDISISLTGPIVNSLILHFTDRWNYIFNQKYIARTENKYQPIESNVTHAPPVPHLLRDGGRIFGEVHQRFHHNFRQMIGREEDEQRQDGGEDSGQAHIQLTRR